MEHFRPARYFMIFCGIWRRHLHDSPRVNKLYSLYSTFVRSFFYSGFLCQVLALLLTSSASDVMLRDICIAFSYFVTFVKLKIFQRENFFKIIEHIYNAEEKYNQTVNEKIRSIYVEAVRRTRRMSIVLFMFTVLAGLTLNGSCYLMYMKMRNDYAVQIAESGTFLVPSDVYLPTPLVMGRLFHVRSHYHVAFFLDMASVMNNCMINIMIQLVLLCTITFEVGELRILQIKFRELKASNLEEEYSAVKELIQQHQMIILCHDRLKKEVKTILLIEFTTLSVQIATILFDLVRTRDITIVFKIIYILLVIVQMFLLAWYANEIREQSSEICTAVYESEWYNMDIRVRKCLLIIMTRARRPLTLFVGPFFPLTNDSAVKTLKAGYSYMSVMNGK